MNEKPNKNQIIEKQLLEYIDIPYFNNNPTYIDRWRKYYQKTKDPQLLLLMFHKNISTLHHWIYIEMAKHFTKINKAEIAHFILEMAIDNNVYSKEKLMDAIKTIPKFEKKYSKGDISCILNQNNICALGKIWNKFEEFYYYESILPKMYVNFDMFMSFENAKLIGHNIQPQDCEKIKENLFNGENNDMLFEPIDYKSFTTILRKNILKRSSFDNLIDDCSLKDNNSNLNAEVEDYITTMIALEESKDENSLKFTKNSSNYYEVIDENTNNEEKSKKELNCKKDIFSDDQLQEKFKIESSVLIDDVFPSNIEGDLSLYSELFINGFIHIVQEIDDNGFITMKIAKDSDATQTIVGSSFCIQKIDFGIMKALKSFKNYEFLTWQSNFYIMFEYDKLDYLTNIINDCDHNTWLYYLYYSLKILYEFFVQGYKLINPSFIVTSRFDVVLSKFNLSLIDSTFTEYSLINQVKGIFEPFFNFFCEEELNTYITNLNKKILSSDFKKLFIMHKTYILNKI